MGGVPAFVYDEDFWMRFHKGAQKRIMRTERPSDQPGGRLVVVDRSRSIAREAVGEMDSYVNSVA